MGDNRGRGILIGMWGQSGNLGILRGISRIMGNGEGCCGIVVIVEDGIKRSTIER